MLKKKLLFFIVIPLSVFSQNGVGSRGISLGNTAVTVSDAYSYFYNPAATSKVDKFQIGIAYENKFLLKELQKQNISANIPIQKGVFSFGGQFYGYDLYRNYKFGLGYALPLFKIFSLGVQINYQGLVIGDNTLKSHRATAEIGLLTQVTEEWKIGICLNNVTQTKWRSSYDEHLPIIFKIGTSYNFKKQWILALEAEKNTTQKVNFKGGLEYEFKEKIAVRMGVNSYPLSFFMGIGGKWNGFQLNLGSAYHQVLGWSPNASLCYSWRKNRK